MKNTIRLLTALFVLSIGSLAFAGEHKDCAKDAKECKECAKDCQCDKCKAERAEAAKHKDAAQQPEKK